jgi:hypothetical protein
MHSVSKIQRFRMLQLMVHCSKHCAFKGLVTITEPGGICHTCHACIYIVVTLRQFELVRMFVW